MKKLLALIMVLMLATCAFGATGWFSDYVLLDVNSAGTAGGGSGTGYYWIGSDPLYGTQLDGANLGVVNSLVLDGCDMQYWSDDQDRTGGAVYYEIWNSDGSVQVVGMVEKVWSQEYLGGNNYKGTLSGLEINLLGLLEDLNTYQLHIYAKSWGSSQGDNWLSNGGDNYVATFTTAEGATPITLASFTAKAKNGVVELAWTTASETENSHFLVYRDGDVIAQVDGAGTTSESNDYVVVDDAVVPGVHEYALADVSYAGVEKVHETVSVEVAASVTAADFVLNKAYPNPFNPTTMITMDFAEASNAVVNIYNTNGALIENLHNGHLEAGSHELVWNASNMTSGVYIVKMMAGNVMSSQKIVLMK